MEMKKRKLKIEPNTPKKKPKITKEVSNNQPTIKNKSSTSNDEKSPLWEDYELLAEQQDLDIYTSQNIINLFENDCTIPFIARYRKAQTNNMDPVKLRDVKECYENIQALKTKIKTVLKNVMKVGTLNEQLELKILNSRTLEELEHIYAPYKPGGKQTLAERAKKMGLEVPALKIVEGHIVDLNTYVQSGKLELGSLGLVQKKVVHIISSIIATDSDVLSFFRKCKDEDNCILESKVKGKKTVKKEKSKNSTVDVDKEKFELYFDFKIPVKVIKPHQILAINRGEAKKILSVKITVPDYVFNKFSNFCIQKWKLNSKDQTRFSLFTESIKDSYDRLLQPLLTRLIRSELKAKATKASYEVFATNLKHLLLAPPLKNKSILAMDPGFAKGCKLAVISKTGSVLAHSVIYPLGRDDTNARKVLKILLEENQCNIIALGNGTACRQTEEWLSKIIKSNYFAPLDISYLIVNEAGASIYSCSSEARKEFPDLDPNIISAVSLARRVQDPLAELVKIEPQHLGVGMYQHDVRQKQLADVLNEVVTECVSFVGVDLNTTSQCLLRKIAGLSDKRAEHIIEFRKKSGPFQSRQQLMDVKGIGPKIFEQCAGFLRILPNQTTNNAYNPLDSTDIHPESYQTTTELLKQLKLDQSVIGTAEFVNKIKTLRSNLNLQNLAVKLNTTVETLDLCLDSLGKPLNYDMRTIKDETTLFKKGIMDVSELKVGAVLTGRVCNATHFGCFVDIGVGSDGLIHLSKMRGLELQVGDRVEVKVESVSTKKKRIELVALKKL